MAFEGVVITEPGVGTRTVAVDTVSGKEFPALKLLADSDGNADATKLVSSSYPLPTAQAFGTPKLTKESVGTSAGQIVATAQTGRRLVKLYADPNNTAPIYYRFTSGVSTTTGLPLLPGQVADEPLTDGGSATIYCISSAASQTLWVREYAP